MIATCEDYPASAYHPIRERDCLTPLTNGISESGSVAMLASSRNTMGKSMPSRYLDEAERHVVQI
jgi:hypothetical protein